ncbi:trypsin beta-like [Anticarsia gemmatalis]|uniref:trypsin beta-like n=1 Tax=Anticarsia gemmatalis TaxID=129554 RepID=UPI003F771A87
MYDPVTRAHDIALLRLAQLDDITRLTHNLLPKSSFGISGDCTIYGYGTRSPLTTETSEVLLAGRLRLVSLDQCEKALSEFVAPKYDSGMICAIGDGIDACQGDSGSPLICSDGKIHGISSYGMSCAVSGLPGVYTSVGANLQWILDNLKDD